MSHVCKLVMAGALVLASAIGSAHAAGPKFAVMFFDSQGFYGGIQKGITEGSKGAGAELILSNSKLDAAAEALGTAAISLSINGQVRQQGAISQMIWSVAECIAALSRLVELQPGDILLTGTPAGVGEVHPGDKLHAQCEGIGELYVEYFVDGGR